MKHQAIDGERVFLDRLRYEHLSLYIKSYSPLIQALLHVRDITQELSYLYDKLSDAAAFFYVIFEKQSDILIGAIEIRSPVYRSQLYCWLNEYYWGKGYLQEAMYVLIPLYFSLTKEEVISARVDRTNARSLQALQRVGFVIERVVPGAYGSQYQLIFRKQ